MSTKAQTHIFIPHQSVTPPHSRMSLANVEAAVNEGRDRADICAQLLLHSSKTLPVIVSDEIDGKSQVTKSSGTSNAVKVRLTVLGKVEVDDHVY